MRLGTETASVTNHVMSRAVRGQPDPKIGMGATLLAWTDRYPATIVEVRATKHTVYITVQEDDAKRIDKNGLSESQTYEFTPNQKARKTTFRRGKNGMWQEVHQNDSGRWASCEGYGLRIGERDKYYDFSF
jgi:hypothetical protein